MTVSLAVRSNPARSYPEEGDRDWGQAATQWAQDVTSEVNLSATAASTMYWDAIVGSAAQVTAGTATHASIAAAIAAVSSGESIYIKPGTYNQTAQLDINKAVFIVGAGEGSVIASAAGIASGAVVKISASGVVFRDVKIDIVAGTPDYALEIAAGVVRTNLDIKAAGAYATTFLNNLAGANVVVGSISTASGTVPCDFAYVDTFNATTDWGAAAGGYYTQTVAYTTHLRGPYPSVILQALDGADYVDTLVDRVLTDANGSVSFRVVEVPDGRFQGRVIIK